ncbi:hypothetical protein EIY72_25855 [Pseudomonas vancouverensis]|uniref:Uncharacterized protein n=1 Tax=Pseudomonas vancouverensis TaxID=95300 RepID=A0A4R4JSX9_PSEVA|nr:hypothetical protein F7R09_06685 [Pseudomonas vancouverensis]TDB57688.1 hypothetical protein EIY72_25855 [Pseudomonas vancouverensis]
MPQCSQIIGVNSVTNIELNKGVLPAPIIRNADWFEKFDQCVSLRVFPVRQVVFLRRSVPIPSLFPMDTE